MMTRTTAVLMESYPYTRPWATVSVLSISKLSLRQCCKRLRQFLNVTLLLSGKDGIKRYLSGSQTCFPLKGLHSYMILSSRCCSCQGQLSNHEGELKNWGRAGWDGRVTEEAEEGRVSRDRWNRIGGGGGER